MQNIVCNADNCLQNIVCNSLVLDTLENQRTRNSVSCRSYNCCRYKIRGKISKILIFTTTQMKWKKSVFETANFFVFFWEGRCNGQRWMMSAILGMCEGATEIVQRPISANPGLNFYPGMFFFSSKVFSLAIFSILVRVGNHQIVGKREFNWICFLSFYIWFQISH